MKKMMLDLYRICMRIIGVTLMVSALFVAASYVNSHMYVEGFQHLTDPVMVWSRFLHMIIAWIFITIFIGGLGACIFALGSTFDPPIVTSPEVEA